MLLFNSYFLLLLLLLFVNYSDRDAITKRISKRAKSLFSAMLDSIHHDENNNNNNNNNATDDNNIDENDENDIVDVDLLPREPLSSKELELIELIQSFAT
jgi:hypothetical protein